ncbi:MAG: menaquinone via futalosine step 1 [Sulfurospirillum sp.]
MIFGKIDYINLLPFHIFLKQSSLNNAFKKAVEHKKGVPSSINNAFEKRKVSAAFISSIKSNKKEIKRLPLGIVAKNSVKSVIVKKGNYLYDPASATSNILSRVLDIQGEVIIGDRALKEYIKNPSKYTDLAKTWSDKYHLPFVFAVLCTNKYHTTYKKLANNFKKRNIKIPGYILQDYAKKRGINAKEIKEYLKLITYDINKKERKSLELFLKKSKALGIKNHMHNSVQK